MRYGNQHAGETRDNEDAEHEPLGRRNLLRLGGIAAAGAAAAAVATAANASAAGAATGTMVYGTSMDADTDHTALTSTNSISTVSLSNTGTGPSLRSDSIDGVAVWGVGNGLGDGVFGVALSGVGVRAQTSSGDAVHSTSNSGTGVDASSTLGMAINAHLDANFNTSDAVHVTTLGTGRALRASMTNQQSIANAVEAETLGSGAAVVGLATGGGTGSYGKSGAPTGVSRTAGVVGDSAAKTGVAGLSNSSTGVYARSATGLALDVAGKAHFSRSGVVSISGTAKSAVVTPTGPVLLSTSIVIAVLQTNQAGVMVASAVPNVPTGKLTINLNVAPGTGHTVKVGWLVLG